MRKPFFLSTAIHTRARSHCLYLRLLLLLGMLFVGVHTTCGFVLAQKGVQFLSEVTTLPTTRCAILFPTSSLRPLSNRIKRRLSLRCHYQHSCEHNGSKGRKEHNDVLLLL